MNLSAGSDRSLLESTAGWALSIFITYCLQAEDVHLECLYVIAGHRRFGNVANETSPEVEIDVLFDTFLFPCEKCRCGKFFKCAEVFDAVGAFQ